MTQIRIGLELGARTLKVAWVLSRRGGKTQWHYREQTRSQDQGKDALSRDLARLLRPLRRSRFSGALIVAAPESYIRQLTVSVPDVKRLPLAVREQLPKLLPFDAERAQIQFALRRQQRVDGQLDCLLFLAACERAVLEQDLESLWQAGWAPREVAPSALALVQAAQALGAIDGEPAVLMNIGERRTTMVLVDAGAVVYARDVTLGDEHLTEALMGHVSVGQSTVSLSREQAEALKRRLGIPDLAEEPARAQGEMPIATYLAMVQPILEQLVSELRRTMTFGGQTAMAARPTRIVISGEGSRLPRFDHWLSRQLAVPVVRLDCERILGVEGAVSAIPYGLALGEQPLTLDLQPRPFRQRAAALQAAARAWNTLVLATLLLWLGLGWWQVRDQRVARTLSALHVRWSALEPVEALQAAIASETQLVQRLVVQDGVPIDWFRRLAHDFPKPVRLTHLAIDGKRQVSLAGEAQERGETPEAYVSELTLWLEQVNVCQNPQVGSTRRLETSGNLVRFELTCQLP